MPILSERKKKEKKLPLWEIFFVSIEYWNSWQTSAVILEVWDSRTMQTYSWTAYHCQ